MAQSISLTKNDLVAALQDQGIENITIQYDLTSTEGVTFETLTLGYKTINLTADQDPSNPNHFSASGSKSYKGLLTPEGVKTVVLANGGPGEHWDLTISIKKAGETKFTALTDCPITETSNANGRINHDSFHN